MITRTFPHGAEKGPFMAPTTLVALWEQQAAATPDAVAVVAGANRATYADVDRQATALAAELQARGIGPEHLVGVCLGRSVEMVVALLGILKSGAAYLPSTRAIRPTGCGT